MPLLRTAYKEIAICVIPVIVIALLARLATGTFSLSEIFAGKSTQSATFIAQSENPKLIPGQKSNLWLEIENTGPDRWTHDGPDSVLLESAKLISDPWYTDHSTWMSQNKVELWEDEVAVGQRGHFFFTIDTDQDPGKYTARFNVVDTNLKPLKGLEPIEWRLTVEDPKYGLELIDHSLPPAVKPGSTVTAWARYKNTGNTVWKNFGANPLALSLTDAEAANHFKAANRWVDDRRVAWLDQSEVGPGQEGTFTFALQIPNDFKQQTIELKPEFENLDTSGIPALAMDLSAGKDVGVKSAAPRVAAGPDFASADDLNFTAVATEHGDCYIARTPSGKVLVFDTAHPSRANVVIEALRRRGISQIDYLFLSHPHWDHIGGASEILNNFDVGRIYINGEGYPFDTYAELAKSLGQVTDRVKLVARGEVVELEDNVRLEILHPEKTLSGISENDEAVNNNSLVARLIFGETAILMPGDIYGSSMEELLAAEADLSSAVMILPHHGNDGFDANEQSFIEAVNPRLVIKSASWSEFQEQASPELRKFLDDRQVRMYTTAELGDLDIAVNLNGGIKLAAGSFTWK